MGNVRYHTRLRCAYALYSHGELERALQHWLDALTAPETVAEFYAIIWPSGFNIELDSEKKVIPTGYKPRSYPEKWFGFLSKLVLRGVTLKRTAAAVVSYFQTMRNRLLARSFDPISNEYGAVKCCRLVLVDTMLAAARLQCAPPRLQDTISLLRDPAQSCDLESLATLMAAGGPTYVEPLLWLYRSKHAHKRALTLIMDMCNWQENSRWNCTQGWRWKARYLRWLWFSRKPTLVSMVREHVASVFYQAPALGLAIFTGADMSGKKDDVDSDQPPHTSSRGMATLGIAAWMKKLDLKGGSFNAAKDIQSSLHYVGSPLQCSKGRAVPEQVGQFPLHSGASVACAYLEHVIYAGEEPAILHMELATTLLDQVKLFAAVDPAMVHLYRTRLRNFLRYSDKYECNFLLSRLPGGFLHEKALILSQLAAHSAVLDVYALKLSDDNLAEIYSSTIWLAAKNMPQIAKSEEVESALDIYVRLARRYASRAHTGKCLQPLEHAVDVIRRNFRRIHPLNAIECCPENVSMTLCSNLVKDLLHFTESERRAAIVKRNLLRVQYADLKHEGTQRQLIRYYKLLSVPRLEALGKILRSLQPVVLEEFREGIHCCHVACVGYLFESHLVLQFHVTNKPNGQRIKSVHVHAKSLGNVEDYIHDGEVMLKLLTCNSTGHCYVLFRRLPTRKTANSLACKLRFSVTTDIGDLRVPTEQLQEISLKDIDVQFSPPTNYT